MTFHYTGCLIGILIMENIILTELGSIASPKYPKQPGALFIIAQLDSSKNHMFHLYRNHATRRIIMKLNPFFFRHAFHTCFFWKQKLT